MLPTLFFYNFILFFSTYLVWLSEKVKSGMQEKLVLLLTLVVVVLPVGLRYGLGLDYFSYESIFNHIANTGDGGSLELGFFWLNRIVSYFGFDYWVFTLLFTFLIYFIAMLAYPKGSKALIHFLFLLLLYFQSFNQIRSVLVLSIMLFAIFNYLEDGKKFKYFSLVFIAVLFHKSAIVYMVFPLIDKLINLRMFRALWFFILLSMLGVYAFGNQIVELVFGSDITKLITRIDYTDSKYAGESSFGTGLGYMGMLFVIFYPILFLKSILAKEPKNKFLLFFIIFCLGSVLLKKFSIIFGRLELVFYLGYIFSIYVVYKNTGLVFRKSYVVLSCIFFLMIFNVTILRGGVDYTSVCINSGKRVAPYTSIFEDGSHITHGSACRR